MYLVGSQGYHWLQYGLIILPYVSVELLVRSKAPAPPANPINVIIKYADDTVVGFISDGDQIKLLSHVHIFSPLLFLMPIWWLKDA